MRSRRSRLWRLRSLIRATGNHANANAIHTKLVAEVQDNDPVHDDFVGTHPPRQCNLATGFKGYRSFRMLVHAPPIGQ